MCQWVGSHAPSFGRQLWGLPSRVEYLPPQGVLLPLVLGTTASLLWLELRGHSAWQATPSWTVYRLACHRLLPWLRVTFTMVPDAAWSGADEYRSCHWPSGSAGSPQCVRPMECWFFPLPWPPYVCAVSWATWLLFTGVPAWFVVLRLRCPGSLGSCSPVCSLGLLCCVCGVLGYLAPIHQCARSVCCVVCAASRATWLLFTGAPAPCVALRVRCPGPPGVCSRVCLLGVLCCVCGVLGHLAPVHRCARSVGCVARAVSWAPWLLFTGVPARCVVSRVHRRGPLGSCSPVRPLGVLCCVGGVLGHLAPVHRCARWVCCSACAVSWATWLPFTGVPALWVVLRVRCLGPLGSCSPVCPLGVLCCACHVLGHLALVHRCARWVCCFACAASWATWLLFTGVPTGCVVLRLRSPGPRGSCSPMCPLGVLCCSCGVLGPLAPVHRCYRLVGCVARMVSWAAWLLFTGVTAWWVALPVWCPGPLGSCSPLFSLGVLCCGLRVRCCVFGASLRGAHSSIRTAAVRSR